MALIGTLVERRIYHNGVCVDLIEDRDEETGDLVHAHVLVFEDFDQQEDSGRCVEQHKLTGNIAWRNMLFEKECVERKP